MLDHKLLSYVSKKVNILPCRLVFCSWWVPLGAIARKKQPHLESEELSLPWKAKATQKIVCRCFSRLKIVWAVIGKSLNGFRNLTNNDNTFSCVCQPWLFADVCQQMYVKTSEARHVHLCFLLRSARQDFPWRLVPTRRFCMPSWYYVLALLIGVPRALVSLITIAEKIRNKGKRH